LAERLAVLGVPGRRLSVIENVIRPAIGIVNIGSDTGPLRVGFFGQISRLKGINVLFDAAELLEAEQFGDVVFDIYGDYRGQPMEFQEEFLKRLAGAGRNICFHGAYDPQRVDLLMRQIDVAIVPSIWWENSPVVIQEALRNRRPVICSDIGGMAEKVRDGTDGWHFPAGNPISLSALLKHLCRNRKLVRRASATTRRPPTVREIVDAHINVFRAPPDRALG
jgi:glycosyltransferase involved in cell wall biosynthesis